ncbi:M28 family peptidase [Flagellimonas sp. DF-77]|uniref:M28 family peptidase n=1 Tax=Flagellimonas algarum TaxID=3230298 RepID=UPI0033984D04
MNFSRSVSFFLIILAVIWSYTSLSPGYEPDGSAAENEFSVDRALAHVKSISVETHGVGFAGHQQVRSYIISQLNQMGLETTTQTGYTTGGWGNLSKAINILARIKGSSDGKALMLLTHYDSSPHSSFGASDAGSGVATILEGIRAFLAENGQPRNDIIILISDAEELGLNGADLFVNQHPWAKEVGLVLNFEARGSGGPSYMLIETNRGNGKMIQEFVAASPEYPVANSLAYSIYKMLPNDTDLTVFREDGDIEGYNFAFIDDHFDYHTAKDTYERLDRESLAHQGSYLMPLLAYFSKADINDMKSLDNYVYFNIPVFKLVFYPFEWIWPMLGLALLLFVALLIAGFRKKALSVKGVFTGFVPLLTALVIAGIAGYISWPALKWWYPGFQDILHGFPYNGHMYIVSMSFLALTACFWVYSLFKKIELPDLLVAPITLWLIICILVALYLKGASFFVVPLLGLLGALLVTINQKKPNPMLLLVLALPAVLIYAPFIKMFPVGLGLGMLTAATVFVVLLFVFILPLIGQSKAKHRFTVASLAVFLFFSVKAHLNTKFTEDRPKPSSLLYVYDADERTAQWATYDQDPIPWNAQFLGVEKEPSGDAPKVFSSKYNTRFTFTATAPDKKVAAPDVTVILDTLIGEERKLSVCITPERPVNRLEIFTNDVPIKKAWVNGLALDEYYLANRTGNRLITHYVSDNDYTELEVVIDAAEPLELRLFEASNDLLRNPLFSVPERPENSIPMPFVLNDAILVTKKVKFD